jgi:hypothetical protein
MIRKSFVGCIVGIMILFMVSILLRVFTINILIEKFHIDNTFTRIVFLNGRPPDAITEINNIDWERLYPFRDSLIININTFDKYLAKIHNVQGPINDYLTEGLLYCTHFVEMAFNCENFYGWKLHETVYDIGDGWLTKVLEKTDNRALTTAIEELNEYLKKSDIAFLYVQNPYKICRRDSLIGINDFSNENADNLLDELSLNNIPFLDLRENIHEENLDHHELFYKTDHHWKAETGLWATKIISRELNERFGFEIDLNTFDPSRYRFDVYKNYFLGSLGKKVTLARVDPDDGVLIYPKFDTNVSLQIPTRNINATGAFDIFYWQDQINEIGYYNKSFYEAYLYSNNAVTIIHNHLLHDGKKILFIKDSFVVVVAPFVGLGVEHVELLDLRYFTGSVETYIEQHKPDIVIVMYNPDAITASHRVLFNFR